LTNVFLSRMQLTSRAFGDSANGGLYLQNAGFTATLQVWLVTWCKASCQRSSIP